MLLCASQVPDKLIQSEAARRALRPVFGGHLIVTCWNFVRPPATIAPCLTPLQTGPRVRRLEAPFRDVARPGWDCSCLSSKSRARSLAPSPFLRFRPPPL